MGAVFGMFAGFYYWIERITSFNVDETLATIHFWTFFIGVNITFFPMHFLGLSGMPRRIPDYPDAYWAWNQIASIGSLISVFSALLFFYIIYNLLTTGNSRVSNTEFLFSYLAMGYLLNQQENN
jgi:heme/copper-type cytochrome/quinol oxidase subunit 1